MVPDIGLQGKTIAGPAVTFGNGVLLVTFTIAVLVHPLEGSVTVTVYVPGELTEGVLLVPPDTIPGPAQL